MQHQSGSYLDNVLEQPQIISALLDHYQESSIWEAVNHLWTPPQSSPILLTGMGASDSALWPLWYYLNRQGYSVQKVETSQLIHYLPNLYSQSGLCIVVSQSGESIEIRRLMEQIQARKKQNKPIPTVLSVTTAPGNALAKLSDLALHTNAGAEVGVATKTFTSTLALLHLLGQALTHTLRPQTYASIYKIAAHQSDILKDWQARLADAIQHLKDVKTYALVGRGPTQAVVEDGALIVKESLRRLAEGFSGGEFRHGPMEMLSSDLGVIVFTSSGSTLELSQRLATDVQSRSGCLVSIGQSIPSLSSVQVQLPACDPYLTPMLEILPIQLMVAEWAKPLEWIPGEFRWGGKVVQQE